MSLVTENVARCNVCPAANMTTLCLASACGMGWRWWDKGDIDIRVTDEHKAPEGDDWTYRGKLGKKHSWSRPWGDRRRGYCGFAGKPDAPWDTSVVPARELKQQED